MTERELWEMLSPAIRENARRTITRWLERGDGCAVYENKDLGSSSVGHKKFVSYGSQAAQLEMGAPPKKLPDIGGQINWRYQLIGTCQRKEDD